MSSAGAIVATIVLPLSKVREGACFPPPSPWYTQDLFHKVHCSTSQYNRRRCRVWVGSTFTAEYEQWVNTYGYSRYAHIALWELWPGQAESNTLYACRDRRCVRVCHLVPGTWSVTSRDCSGATRQVAALV